VRLPARGKAMQARPRPSTSPAARLQPLACDFPDQVVASLRSVERALDCVNHREIEPEARRSVAARIDVDTGGADVETRICQPSTHRGRKTIEVVYPNGAFVERRTLHLSAVERRHSLRTPNRIDAHGYLREKSLRDSHTRTLSLAALMASTECAGVRV